MLGEAERAVPSIMNKPSCIWFIAVFRLKRTSDENFDIARPSMAIPLSHS